MYCRCTSSAGLKANIWCHKCTASVSFYNWASHYLFLALFRLRHQTVYFHMYTKCLYVHLNVYAYIFTLSQSVNSISQSLERNTSCTSTVSVSCMAKPIPSKNFAVNSGIDPLNSNQLIVRRSINLEVKYCNTLS